MRVLQALTSFMALMPLLLALSLFRRLRNNEEQVFTSYLGYSVLTEILAWTLMLTGHENHLVYNCFDIVTIGVMAWLWSRRIRSIHRKFWLLPFVLIPVIRLLVSTPFRFNSGNYFIIYMFQGVFAAYSLVSLVDQADEPIANNFLFWLFSGLLLYAFSTLNIYLLLDYALRKTNWGFKYYQIYNFLMSLLSNILYAKAFLCLKKTQQY